MGTLKNIVKCDIEDNNNDRYILWWLVI
jgi:hypothetical protein